MSGKRRTVTATRYVMPFKEGGSLPGLVEADDDGLYVVKFRGAGQGPKVLIAELIAARLAEALELHVPEVVFMQLEAALGRAEPDSEIRELLKASVGLNLALDYLPGSVTFDPIAGPFPDVAYASKLVMFDAFITNVDRTPKNPNMLCWHGGLWLIDHGASLYFQHMWSAEDRLAGSQSAFNQINRHVLLPFAKELQKAADELRSRFNDALFDDATAQIPSDWMTPDSGFENIAALRTAYRSWLSARLAALPIFLEEAERARAQLV
ncbi:MAG: HipA family kinase [Myxococcaceae bacterium]